jgi:outer membrane receptor protein involved in Fe transport
MTNDSGIDQVEAYRGPQSAAFGRSTFAGAINHVTADAAEQFELK